MAIKTYGNKDIFSKKSLKESKKFHYGEEIIKFLDKYGYNKRGEDFEQKKDYSTVTYMYAIPKGMRPQTPYVEFTVDADNDAFIFGEFFTDGRKGYSTEFDSVEDLEYFISNANYSNVDLTEKKSATKSIKERYEYKVDEITDIIRSNGVLFDSCNILDDYAWNIEHGKTTWLSKYAYDEISIAYANCIQYLKDMYNGKKKYELIDDLTKFFDKVISLTESKKSMKEEIYDIGDYTYPKVVTVDNVDKILKSVRDGILDGYRFNCENIDISDLIYSNSFQKYFLNGGKIEWSKVKKSPFNGELVVWGKLMGNNHYDINIALESKENPFGYSKISHFNFFKKFDWIESKKSARKSLKEGINDELIATSSDGETTLYLSDERQANHGKDPHYEFKLGENGYFTRYVRCDDNRCENVVLDWIKEFNLDISKSEISKIIKLHESNKSAKKSLKESKDSDFFNGIAKEYHFSKDEKTRYKDKTYISVIGVLFDRINNAIKMFGRNSDEEYKALSDCWDVIQSAKQNGWNVDYEENKWNKIAGLPNYH